MEDIFIVTSSPHLRDKSTTRGIMLDVLIALIPAVIAGVYFFGARTLLVIFVTVLSCVVFEYITRRILKRDNTLGDLSAVVTGVLLALNLPPSIPLWIAFVGGFIAIVIVKQLFGGIGQNFMNPALTARVMLMISWPGYMTRWSTPGQPDVVSSATPLAFIKGQEAVEGVIPSYVDMFFWKYSRMYWRNIGFSHIDRSGLPVLQESYYS